MLAGVASLLTVTPPDIIVSGDAKLAAFHNGHGYLLSSTKADKIDAEEWLRSAGGVPRDLLPGSWRRLRMASAATSLGCSPWHAGDSPGRAGARSGRARRGLPAGRCGHRLRTGAAAVPHHDDRGGSHRSAARRRHRDLAGAGRSGVATANGARGQRPWVPKPAPYVPFNSAAAAPPDDPAP